MYYLAVHRIACTNLGFNLAHITVLNSVHGKTLNFNHMLMAARQQQPSQLTVMGLEVILCHIYEIFHRLLAHKTQPDLIRIWTNKDHYLPSLSKLIANADISLTEKDKLTQEITDTLQLIFPYFKDGLIVDTPRLVKIGT